MKSVLDYLNKLMQAAKQYGSPMRFWFGPRLAVFISNVKDVEVKALNFSVKISNVCGLPIHHNTGCDTTSVDRGAWGVFLYLRQFFSQFYAVYFNE